MGAVVLRFHLVPPEHRVIVTPADVKAATGKYLVRVFGGNSHAAVSDGAAASPDTHTHLCRPAPTQINPIASPAGRRHTHPSLVLARPQARACTAAWARSSSRQT